jgi:AcrR family transcriptional regulator
MKPLMIDLPSSFDEVRPADARTRIVSVAADLIAAGGSEAATTRAVAVAAGVQAPTIYRLFGDKRGLLDAVAQHGLAEYVASKAARKPHIDPVQDLRDGWDVHVEFGLAHPDLFSIMAGDPRPRPLSAAAAVGVEVLRRRIGRIASAGRLRVSEERALGLVESIGQGTILTLLRQPVAARDGGLSVAAREAVITTITGETTGMADVGVRTAATTLAARLDHTQVLTAGEQHLLRELLDRVANGPETPMSMEHVR